MLMGYVFCPIFFLKPYVVSTYIVDAILISPHNIFL